MTTFGAIGIASTGLTVHRKWLDAVSDNLANINTVRGTDEAAFQAKYVVAEAAGYSTAGASVGTGVRVKGIELLAPVAQDIVVTGHDGDEVGFLVFANVPACRALAGLPADVPPADVLAHPAVRNKVAEGLRAMKALGGGSSTHAARALLMAEPPSVDAGEITDKGYINQSAVLARRKALVAQLSGQGEEVIRMQ